MAKKQTVAETTDETVSVNEVDLDVLEELLDENNKNIIQPAIDYLKGEKPYSKNNEHDVMLGVIALRQYIVENLPDDFNKNDLFDAINRAFFIRRDEIMKRLNINPDNANRKIRDSLCNDPEGSACHFAFLEFNSNLCIQKVLSFFLEKGWNIEGGQDGGETKFNQYLSVARYGSVSFHNNDEGYLLSEGLSGAFIRGNRDATNKVSTYLYSSMLRALKKEFERNRKKMPLYSVISEPLPGDTTDERQDRGLDGIEDTSEPEDIAKIIDDKALRDKIEGALSQLTERQRSLLILRHGLHDGYTYTLDETCSIFHTTKQEIREAEDKCVQLLSKNKLPNTFLNQLRVASTNKPSEVSPNDEPPNGRQ